MSTYVLCMWARCIQSKIFLMDFLSSPTAPLSWQWWIQSRSEWCRVEGHVWRHQACLPCTMTPISCTGMKCSFGASQLQASCGEQPSRHGFDFQGFSGTSRKWPWLWTRGLLPSREILPAFSNCRLPTSTHTCTPHSTARLRLETWNGWIC